jgi:aerobic carbon-monoxide dehydrogenase medium subunit
MYPAPIEQFSAPTSLVEALTLVKGNVGQAVCLAGGMSVMQAIKARTLKPQHVVDLNAVADLRGIRASAGGVRIGAMTRYTELAAADELRGAYQALADAAAHVGDRQVRNRGTLGGSLCWNYLAACSPPTCLALGAQVELAHMAGTKPASRTVAIDDFLKTPLETARRPDELLVAVTLPKAPENAGSAYKKWGLVTDALPVIGVAVFVQTDGSGTCTTARVGVGGLASGPTRAAAIEKGLVGCRAGDAERIAEAFATGGKALPLQSDLWASTEYRRLLLSDLGAAVTATAFARAKGGQ